jgi:hypothetical protein
MTKSDLIYFVSVMGFTLIIIFLMEYSAKNQCTEQFGFIRGCGHWEIVNGGNHWIRK